MNVFNAIRSHLHNFRNFKRDRGSFARQFATNLEIIRIALYSQIHQFREYFHAASGRFSDSLTT